MRVILKGQPVMPNVLSGILRLIVRMVSVSIMLASEGVFHLGQHLVQTIGHCLLAVQPDLVAKLSQKVLESCSFVGSGSS